LTPPDQQLKGAWYPGGFNPCTYQAKTRFQALLSNSNLYRYGGGKLEAMRDDDRAPDVRGAAGRALGEITTGANAMDI
jgi:hypothetical protein